MPKTSTDQPSPVLYVATTLDCWKTDQPDSYARDVGIYGTCYRRLDPEYFAWLGTRMALAQRAAKAGKMTGEQLGDLKHDVPHVAEAFRRIDAPEVPVATSGDRQEEPEEG